MILAPSTQEVAAQEQARARAEMAWVDFAQKVVTFAAFVYALKVITGRDR